MLAALLLAQAYEAQISALREQLQAFAGASSTGSSPPALQAQLQEARQRLVAAQEELAGERAEKVAAQIASRQAEAALAQGRVLPFPSVTLLHHATFLRLCASQRVTKLRLRGRSWKPRSRNANVGWHPWRLTCKRHGV